VPAAALGATIMIIVAKGSDFRSLRSVVALPLRVPNWIALVTDVRADAVGVIAFVGDDDGSRPSSRTSAAVTSWSFPGEIRRRTGRPFASTRA